MSNRINQLVDRNCNFYMITEILFYFLCKVLFHANLIVVSFSDSLSVINLLRTITIVVD